MIPELSWDDALSYKGFIFDLDDTLVQSNLDFEDIRIRLGIPHKTPILEYLDRLPTDIKAIKHKMLLEIEVEKALLATPLPGAIERIHSLFKKEKHVGVLTRNCREVADICLRKFSIRESHILTRDEVKPKPDPEGVLRLLDMWSLKPCDVLFVGDYRYDVECAKQAGIVAAILKSPHIDWADPHLKEAPWGADFWIGSF